MRNRRVDLHGKHIVLTGASSGIGRALAMALADKGAILVLAARRRELLDGVAAEIDAAGHQRPIVIDTDLSAAGAAESLGKAALSALGGAVDVVINNAGANVTGPQSLIGDSAQARALFEVNVWSPLALTATLLPTMMTAGSGIIVNVTSTVQAVPLPLLGYYGASKAALAQATRSLRLELAETPIRVLEVVPGSTDTILRIPFACMDAAPKNEWRANFFRIDRSRAHGDEFSAWQPTLANPADFHVAAAFGRLRFE